MWGKTGKKKKTRACTRRNKFFTKHLSNFIVYLLLSVRWFLFLSFRSRPHEFLLFFHPAQRDLSRSDTRVNIGGRRAVGEPPSPVV